MTKKWTAQEDEFILNHHGSMTVEKMSKALRCSKQTVRNRAKALGVEIFKPPNKAWTPEEESAIIEQLDTLGADALAQQLGRTRMAILVRATQLRASGTLGESPSYSASLTLNLTQEQKEWIEKRAKERGVSASALVRDIIAKLKNAEEE